MPRSRKPEEEGSGRTSVRFATAAQKRQIDEHVNELYSGTLNVPQSQEDLIQEILRLEGALKWRTELESAEASLSEFTRQAWHVVEPATDLVWEPHMDAVCLHLEAVLNGDIRNLIITIPPGSTKSLLSNVMFPAWAWIKQPSLRWIFTANGESLALRDSVNCRRLVESAWYGERWGHVYKLSDDQNLKQNYQNNARGWRQVLTPSSNTTGNRGDIIVGDDLLDAKKAFSDVERFRVKEWVNHAFVNRLNDYKKSKRIVICQRLHMDDIVAMLLEQGGWEHLNLPEEFDPERRCFTSIGWTDWRTYKGELLRPKRFGHAEIAEAKKSLKEYGYQAQHQQDPIMKESGMFKASWFEKNIVDEAQIPRDRMTYVRSWDKAASLGAGAYTAGILVGMARDGRLFVLDVIRRQMSIHEREEVILQTAHLDQERYGRILTVVEQEPGGAGKESALATMGRLVGFNVKLDRVTGSKEVRAQPFASQVEAGNVFLLRSRWVDAFVKECCEFPHGKYLDQVDAAAMAVAHIGRQLPRGTWRLEYMGKPDVEKLERPADEEEAIGRIARTPHIVSQLIAKGEA